MQATTDQLPPILLELVTDASAEDAWAALTDPERVSEWFTDATAVGGPGDPYRLDFGDESVVEGEILEVEPGVRFIHTWRWADATPEQVTRVTWSVEALPGGGSRIALRHEGWSESLGGVTVRDDHEGYWTGYLDDLEALLTGTD
jgi:uncharacterized protein YndB with AHSA1/START domain